MPPPTRSGRATPSRERFPGARGRGGGRGRGWGRTPPAPRPPASPRRNAFLEGEGVLMPRAPDGLDRGEGAPEGRHARDAGGQRRLADEGTVGAGAASPRGVDGRGGGPGAG